jgi:hypothetical protein
VQEEGERDDSPSHLYVIVRTDIGQPHIGIQAAHSILEAVRVGVFHPRDSLHHPNFVFCGVDGLPHLQRAAERLTLDGICFHVWTDSIFKGEATAICTEPLSGSRRRPMRRYQLLKGGSSND